MPTGDSFGGLGCLEAADLFEKTVSLRDINVMLVKHDHLKLEQLLFNNFRIRKLQYPLDCWIHFSATAAMVAVKSRNTFDNSIVLAIFLYVT